MADSIFHFTSPEEAETAFYTAFVSGNLQTMGAVWSRQQVLCVHPGSQAITGYDAVLRSWQHILTDAQPPDIRLKVIQRHRDEVLAVHVLQEHLSVNQPDVPEALILATNVYRKEQSGWLMLQHHASLIQVSHHGRVTLQ